LAGVFFVVLPSIKFGRSVFCSTAKLNTRDSATPGAVLDSTLPLHWQQQQKQHTETHCNRLQHAATQCEALQHTATQCDALQHTATRCNELQNIATRCSTLQRTAAQAGAAFTYAAAHPAVAAAAGE